MRQGCLIRFDGIVTDVLPGGRCRVLFSNGHTATAEQTFPRSAAPTVGDAIVVEVSPYGTDAEQLFFRRIVLAQ